MSNTIEGGVRDFVSAMLVHTVRLTCAPDGKEGPAGSGSGLLVPHDGDLLLLTAGHLFGPHCRWAIETPFVSNNGSLHIALPTPQLLESVDLGAVTSSRIDLAWMRIAIADVKAALATLPPPACSWDIPVYTGPLDAPIDPTESYGYASYNRAYLDAVRNELVREPSFEVGMRASDPDPEGIVRFQLGREHQGHDYYSGASGSPIAGTDGRVVALLLSGDASDNTLTGIALHRYRTIWEATA